MTKERVHKALKLAAHFSEIKCSQSRNEVKPDYREYSLRQLLLLLKKEVLELEDAYVNGTSTYIDLKGKRIFYAGGGQGGQNGHDSPVVGGGSGGTPGKDSSGNLGIKGGGSIFKVVYTAAGSDGDLGCGGGNAGKLGGQGGGAVYIYRMGN